jgi:putative ABC transport system permease protein
MFTAITLLTLAIGIGANTAVFSVIHGILLKPLPFPNPDTLVGLWHSAPGISLPQLNMSPALMYTYSEEGKSFEHLGVWTTGTVGVTGASEPEQVPVMWATSGTLRAIGIVPEMGRWLEKQDDQPGSPDVAILSYGYWQRKMGGDRSALGGKIQIDGKPTEIVGIMPQSFRFGTNDAQLILPQRFDRGKVFMGNFSWTGIARLKPGVTLQQANADVARMIPIAMRSFPPPPGFSMKMFEDARLGPDVHPLKKDVIGDIGPVLWILMGTIGIVLLIACANVANLLLVRAEGRQQELAVRAALGAGWAQIARELLLESVVLGVIGGALGLLVAYGALKLLVYLGPSQLPRLQEIGLDLPVMGFAAAISVFSGLLLGILPVFKYAGRGVSVALRGGGRNASQSRERHRTRSVLVVVQVALAMVLLISSGLMIRTFQSMRNVQPGFQRPAEVQTLRISIPETQVKDQVRVVRMHHDIIRKIGEIPGVTHVGISSSITMDGSNSFDPVFAQDKVYPEGKVPPLRRYKSVAPGFFQAIGNPLVAGRDYNWEEIYEARPVVIVSENLARELWGEPQAAIGKKIRNNLKGVWREVIGVAGDDRHDGVDKKSATTVYWPMLQKDFWEDGLSVRRTMGYVIRSNRVGTESFMPQVRQAVWSVNASLPVAAVRTLDELYRRSMARTSFTLVMLAIAGGMALILGIVGIYGVISYSVSQRTREIGIRMALGAQNPALRRMFLRHGLILASIGVVCGFAAALGLTRLMSSLLFEVSAIDPITYAAVAVLLAGAAALASYLPARRATSVDPLEALRAE